MKKNTEIHYEMKLLSSLAKVFPDETLYTGRNACF